MMEEGDLRINGKLYDPNTMTFREQREVRSIVRKELYGDEAVDDSDLTLADVLPAMVTVLARRDDPSYQLETALDLVSSEVVMTEEDVKASKSRNGKVPPTRKTSTRVPTGPLK